MAKPVRTVLRTTRLPIVNGKSGATVVRVTRDDGMQWIEKSGVVARVSCFTHGDACLENFLTHDGHLTGVLDLGRAGVNHPAQDWALALRRMRDNFGCEAEASLRLQLPPHCADEALLYRIRLLDELF